MYAAAAEERRAFHLNGSLFSTTPKQEEHMHI